MSDSQEVGRYSGPLVIQKCDSLKNEWAVYKGFEFTSYTQNVAVSIPAGFISDLASVPRPLWWFICPAGKHSQAAVVHDYFYVHALISKEVADNVLFDALLTSGVPRFRARLMYLACRLFGRGSYKRKPSAWVRFKSWACRQYRNWRAK